MKTILLIEDNEADQFLGEVVISNAIPDVKIIKARDGQEALDILLGEGVEPDLILLDINMPRMNGHEFLEAYYGQTGEDVPTVVMLTSSNQGKDKERTSAYKSVKDYLLKPITKDNVSSLMRFLDHE